MRETSRPNLRWYQFSLRSLLLLMLATSLVMGWVSTTMLEARRQKEAVEAIEKLGGSVQYDYQLDRSGNEIPNAALPGPALGFAGC